MRLKRARGFLDDDDEPPVGRRDPSSHVPKTRERRQRLGALNKLWEGAFLHEGDQLL